MNNNKKDEKVLSSAVFYFACEFTDGFVLLCVFSQKWRLYYRSLLWGNRVILILQIHIVGIEKVNEAIQVAFPAYYEILLTLACGS